MPIISHLIEKVPNFKTFIKLFIFKRSNHFITYTKVQQFYFYMLKIKFKLCNLKFYVFNQIGAQKYIYLFGVKTNMTNVYCLI